MPKKDSEKYKLDGIHKEYILNKLALHCGQTEIVKAIKTNFGIEISVQGIDYYKREYEKEWREKRSYFNKHIAEIEPFADKSLRVQKRGELIRDIEDEGLWYTVFGKFGDHKKGNHGAINDLLDSIKKEIEPFKIAQTNPDGEGPVEINVKLVD
ncbi:hypothetical protein LCGC14_1125860 [marine sediment metagenome]|uniref:DUF2280 domain-containing protein n=2 Tax=root TaxID=1 RepID=A0A831QK03_9FLAO|nr:DUF2280 domain-containing protein [Pricia antarctica]